MIFDSYFKEIKTADISQLSSLVEKFINEWNENQFINEFEYKFTKNDFFDLVCEKIIDNGVYPMSVHKLLVEELTGKQAKSIINNLPLSNEIVSDYEAKFLASNKVYEKIDFIEARGIKFETFQDNILKCGDFRALKYFANTVEKANIKTMINRLVASRIKYPAQSTKRLAENRNLCAYLKALETKRALNNISNLDK